MRRAQERVLAGRPYAEKIRQVIADLAAQSEGALHPLLERREVNRVEVIHITADRGLCGGLNTNMNRTTAGFILEQAAPIVLITVGRKGRDFMRRYGREVRAEFTGISDRPVLLDTLPISRIVIDDYTERNVDVVYLAYTLPISRIVIDDYTERNVDVVYLAYNQFISTMTQRPVLQQLLPVEPAGTSRGYEIQYIYEPSSEAVLAELLPRSVEMQVYHAMLESIASEQSARMVAMRNATENANELVQDLTLMYNKARQEMITKELLDITGGAEALV